MGTHQASFSAQLDARTARKELDEHTHHKQTNKYKISPTNIQTNKIRQWRARQHTVKQNETVERPTRLSIPSIVVVCEERLNNARYRYLTWFLSERVDLKNTSEFKAFCCYQNRGACRHQKRGQSPRLHLQGGSACAHG